MKPCLFAEVEFYNPYDYCNVYYIIFKIILTDECLCSFSGL